MMARTWSWSSPGLLVAGVRPDDPIQERRVKIAVLRAAFIGRTHTDRGGSASVVILPAVQFDQERKQVVGQIRRRLVLLSEQGADPRLNLAIWRGPPRPTIQVVGIIPPMKEAHGGPLSPPPCSRITDVRARSFPELANRNFAGGTFPLCGAARFSYVFASCGVGLCDRSQCSGELVFHSPMGFLRRASSRLCTVNNAAISSGCRAGRSGCRRCRRCSCRRSSTARHRRSRTSPCHCR